MFSNKFFPGESLPNKIFSNKFSQMKFSKINCQNPVNIFLCGIYSARSGEVWFVLTNQWQWNKVSLLTGSPIMRPRHINSKWRPHTQWRNLITPGHNGEITLLILANTKATNFYLGTRTFNGHYCSYFDLYWFLHCVNRPKDKKWDFQECRQLLDLSNIHNF